MKIEGLEGPEDGHTFRIRANSRMASGIMGPDDTEPHDYQDSAWWGPDEFVVEVRAWSQREALLKAAEVPLADWRLESTGRRLGGDPDAPA